LGLRPSLTPTVPLGADRWISGALLLRGEDGMKKEGVSEEERGNKKGEGRGKGMHPET